MTDLIGKRLGQYQILQEIGGGGMAVVYKAYQASLGRYVAIKVLLPHLSQDREFIKRFRREATAAAKLEHPNIIHVYDVGQERNLHYLVMSYVAGPSLAAKLKRDGALGSRTALSILQQVGAALDYAHAQGVIHRDVKPSNILLTPNGQAVLSDFGIARPLADSRLTQTGIALGTPAYMSPEQVEGQAVDGRSDLYSLGIVLYEMLTGQVPFHADTPVAVLYKQVHQGPTAPSRVNPAISGRLDRVILRALQKDPRRRYASAEEMVRDFAKVVSAARGLGAGPRSGAPAQDKTTLQSASGKTLTEVRPRPPQHVQLKLILMPLILAITSLAIAAVVGIYLLREHRPTPTILVLTPSPTLTQSPRPTATQSPSPTPTQSVTPTPTPSPSPTPTRSPSPTPTRSPSPSPTRSRTPSITPTATVEVMRFDLLYRGCIPHDMPTIGQVKGQVFDRDGRVIEGALVYITVTEKGKVEELKPARSNQDGWYEWNLTPGQLVQFVRLTVPGRVVALAPLKDPVISTAGCYQRIDIQQR